MERHQLIERSIIKKYRKSIWNNFVGAIKDYKLIEPDDKIAVCISGGKDSMLLAKCMQHLQKYSDFHFDVEYIVMDPGYVGNNRAKIIENAEIIDIPIRIYDSPIFETVYAAESYSEKIVIKIRTIELLSALDMLSLVILVIMQTLKAMQMAMQNRLLEQKAFVDAHTGLPNKNACNELLNKKDIITGSTACIMFDLNNLKTVNDTMGHSAGDQLIMNFSKLLRSVIPEKDFVGRYGGDEFIAVIYHTNEAEIKEILKVLYREKDRLNSYENKIPIDYACGWALSSDNMSCTMQMLLDDADVNMYKNKQLCKKLE